MYHDVAWQRKFQACYCHRSNWPFHALPKDSADAGPVAANSNGSGERLAGARTTTYPPSARRTPAALVSLKIHYLRYLICKAAVEVNQEFESGRWFYSITAIDQI